MRSIQIINYTILMCIFSLNAQIVHYQASPASWNLKSDKIIASFQLPRFDNAKLVEEENQRDLGQTKPHRFAKPVQTNLNPQNSGTWSTLPSGERVWRLRVESPGAVNLNIIFNEYRLQKGEELFIYSMDRQHVLGPFTHLNNKTWGTLATVPLDVDNLMVEFKTSHLSRDMGKLSIGQIAHGFRGLKARGFGDSESCNNNVICEEWTEWSCHTRSIVLIIDDGEDACSGSLLNNTSEDGRPIISTADHCLEGADGSKWSYVFNWTSPTCDPSENAPKDHSISGSTLLVNNEQSDFALLELSEKPPAEYGVYYAGWDATGGTPQQQVGIHHPSNDIMKISLDTDPATKGNWNGGEVWTVFWNDGTTEGGSSGSPLFDENFRVIGQLYGGGAGCDYMDDSDNYGRLDVSWGLGASEILDPTGTGIKTMDAIAFDGDCAEETPIRDQSIFTQNNLDVNIEVQSSIGQRLEISSSINTPVLLQNIQGKTISQYSLRVGENEISLPKGIEGVHILSFPQSNTENRLININTH